MALLFLICARVVFRALRTDRPSAIVQPRRSATLPGAVWSRDAVPPRMCVD